MKSKVYFTKTISPEKVLDLYKLLDKKLDGNVAIKLHSGEVGNLLLCLVLCLALRNKHIYY